LKSFSSNGRGKFLSELLQVTAPFEETRKPKFVTPMKLYLDQTPASADSKRKLPGLVDANFSKIVKGVSVPENTESTIGIT
jgi:hypothetical protein